MVIKRKPSLRTTPARPQITAQQKQAMLKATKRLKKTEPKVPTIDKKLTALKPSPRAVAVGPARPKRVGKAPVRRTKGGSKDMGSTSSRRKQNTQSTRATRLAQAKVAQAQRAASQTRPKNLKRASTRSKRRLF